MGTVIPTWTQGTGRAPPAGLQALNISQHRFLHRHLQLSCMCRLNTVLTCNRVLVLNAGAVEEFDAPQKLLQVCVLCGSLARCLACFRLAVLQLFRLRPQPKRQNSSLLPSLGPLNTPAATISLPCDAHLTPVLFLAAEPPQRFLCNDGANKDTSWRTLNSYSNKL